MPTPITGSDLPRWPGPLPSHLRMQGRDRLFEAERRGRATGALETGGYVCKSFGTRTFTAIGSMFLVNPFDGLRPVAFGWYARAVTATTASMTLGVQDDVTIAGAVTSIISITPIDLVTNPSGLIFFQSATPVGGGHGGTGGNFITAVSPGAGGATRISDPCVGQNVGVAGASLGGIIRARITVLTAGNINDLTCFFVGYPLGHVHSRRATKPTQYPHVVGTEVPAVPLPPDIARLYD